MDPLPQWFLNTFIFLYTAEVKLQKEKQSNRISFRVVSSLCEKSWAVVVTFYNYCKYQTDMLQTANGDWHRTDLQSSFQIELYIGTFTDSRGALWVFLQTDTPENPCENAAMQLIGHVALTHNM